MNEKSFETVVFDAVPAGLPVMLEFVNNCLAQSGLSDQECYDVQMGAEEWFNNIIEYAYQEQQGAIQVKCSLHTNNFRFKMVVTDSGEPFNPLLKKDPDIKVPYSSRPVGGLGIFLLKKMFTLIEYERVNEKNQLTLYKK
jgi:anti-sigma regulatory factor (Ser/Thr protein kinase)